MNELICGKAAPDAKKGDPTRFMRLERSYILWVAYA